MRKNHSKIVCIKLVHLPYFDTVYLGVLVLTCRKLHAVKVKVIPQQGFQVG